MGWDLGGVFAMDRRYSGPAAWEGPLPRAICASLVAQSLERADALTTDKVHSNAAAQNEACAKRGLFACARVHAGGFKSRRALRLHPAPNSPPP